MLFAPTTLFSDLPIQLLSASNVEMTIGGTILPLSKAATRIVEERTSETIAGAIIAVLGEDQIDSLLVDVNIISPVSRKLRARARNLAETKLTLDVVILIQSLIENHFMDRYIYGAFNENNETARFIGELKGSGDAAFANVDSVSVAPLADDNVQGRTEDPNSDTTNANQDIAITTVVSVVVIIAAVGIGIAAFFFFKGRSSNKGKEIHHESLDGTGSSPHSISSDDSVEIHVNNDMGCEISSLGDFSSIPEHQAVGTTNIHGRIEEDDASFYEFVVKNTDNGAVEHKTTNELGKIEDYSSFGDYDAFKTSGYGTIKPKKTTTLFQPNIKPTVPEPIGDHDLSSDGELYFQKSFCGGSNTSSMADTNDYKPTTLSSAIDDGTLDTQVFLEDDINSFEVKVPPGLLGLVLIDSDKGVTAVHLVKDSSPLAGRVQTGDRLVSVDGKDVTLMSATDVSVLVAAKKKNQSRRLLFVRPLENQRSVPKMERDTTNPLKRGQRPRLFDTGTDFVYDSDKEYVA